MRKRLPGLAGIVLIVCCCVAFVSGCARDPRIVTYSSMGALSAGMTPEKAAAVTGAVPNPVFTFEIGGERWAASYYVHRAGDSSSRYLALYDDSGLRYWGFIHEFERQSDREIAAACRAAELEYSKWFAEQKKTERTELY